MESTIGLLFGVAFIAIIILFILVWKQPSGDISSPSTTAEATADTLGLIQLTGDLTGTGSSLKIRRRSFLYSSANDPVQPLILGLPVSFGNLEDMVIFRDMNAPSVEIRMTSALPGMVGEQFAIVNHTTEKKQIKIIYSIGSLTDTAKFRIQNVITTQVTGLTRDSIPAVVVIDLNPTETFEFNVKAYSLGATGNGVSTDVSFTRLSIEEL